MKYVVFMFCTECGNKIPDIAKFCPDCGSSQVSKESNSMPITNQSLPAFNEKSNTKYIAVGVVVFFLLLIVIFSGGGGGDAQVQYDGCWAGAFHNGESIISISGCGNESFECLDSGFCTINAQKQDDSLNELCVKLGGEKACTTSEYGIAML